MMLFPVPNQQLQQPTLPGYFAEPSPPSPFRWICNGVLYSVRPETRGQRVYWYMKKRVNGRQHNVYLGPAGKLSAELLNNAVAQIEVLR